MLLMVQICICIFELSHRHMSRRQTRRKIVILEVLQIWCSPVFPKCIKPLQKDKFLKCFKVCPRFSWVKATKTTRWRWQKDCVHIYKKLTCMWSIRWFVLTTIHWNNLPEKFAVLWFYGSSVFASDADFWFLDTISTQQSKMFKKLWRTFFLW